jgi:hypothetical protein
MGLVISKGLTLRKGYIGTDDPDAEAYIAAVEAADLAADPTAQPLETATKVAIHSFVKGAKADGFWPAIKASCILAGARTRLGALTPLVGTAPTSFNFVDGDYNRKTGLVGNGSTKYLNSNRNNNADPQNSHHMAVYASSAPTSAALRFPTYIGAGGASTGTTAFARNESNGVLFARNRSSSFDLTGGGGDVGLIAVNRSTSSAFTFRRSGSSTSYTRASQTSFNGNLFVYNVNAAGSPASDSYSNARLAFYSIGESLDLALLDARVTDLINAFGAAIP